MAARADVTPNRRGLKSRELVLDAAERVMAEHGFEAATIARVVQEAGIPLSSVYHCYGSKDGILLAVMERGAERFFADTPVSQGRRGRPTRHLARFIARAAETLERHPDFLRLLIVFATGPGCRRRRDPGRRRRHPGGRPRAPATRDRHSPSTTSRPVRSPTGSPASHSPRSTGRSRRREPIARSGSRSCCSLSRRRSSLPVAA